MAKFSSGLSPSIFLVSAISASPSAEPCDFAVPCALGAGHAITECILINDGAEVCAFAALMALSSAGRSTFPSACAATSITCQPYAR
ncbi:unannotated protein [freshwater metagenome]|uniref:Unannotated protein n=1 Tax=freshwater metagenome TaxID=449393 RepID=A0A6J6MQU4_9ZZZZ